MLRVVQLIKNLLSKHNHEESGQIMVLALITLCVGALIITPTSKYMATGAKSTVVQQRLTQEYYAADAGVEYAMWCIRSNTPCNPTITVDGKTVNVTVSTISELPYGPVVTGSSIHADWMQVSSDLVDMGDGTYTFTITMVNTVGSGTSPIKLEQIGVGLPDGFTHEGPYSGITTAEPQVNDSQIIWNLSTPKPEVAYGETKTQTFVVRGSGIPIGQYSWIIASRDDIGTISSCMGYTATAACGNTTIEADIIYSSGMVFPNTWKVD